MLERTDAAGEFAQRLRAQRDDTLDEFVVQEMLTPRPLIFDSDGDWARFREFLGVELGLGGEMPEVYIIGSGLTGFSLAPGQYFAPFTDTSDIDVAVVHPGTFDAAWATMLAWDYMTLPTRPQPETDWLAERRRETWRGWYEPTRWHRERTLNLRFPSALKPLRDIAARWFANFQSLARYPHREVPRHRVVARLYRTRSHVVRYHASGLRELRRQLVEA